METLREVAARISGLHSTFISAHVAPDPDAVASAYALSLALKSLQIASSVFLVDGVPERMRPLLRGEPVIARIPAEPVDAVIVVDTAEKRRLSNEPEKLLALGKTVFNIDHHGSNPSWGAVNYVDPDAPATAVLVYDLLKLLQVTITPAIADLLLAGLMDDTGSFRFQNASARGFLCAAALVEAGANPAQVSNALYFTLPERVFRIRAAALATLRTVLAGAVGIVSVSQEELAGCGASAEDTDGIVDLVRALAGTKVGVFIREIETGWKVSLRSKEASIDVDGVARVFGGGGHKMAAGCRLPGTLAQVEAAVIAELRRVLE